MSRYYDGYEEAREKVYSNSAAENLQLLDDLFGRDRLPVGTGIQTDGYFEVRREALRQIEIEFRKHFSELTPTEQALTDDPDWPGRKYYYGQF